MSFFAAEQICAGYGKEYVIENVSFQVDAGCVTGVIGANGSGKTTLLKALCGILPHKGSCRLEETVLDHLSPRQMAGLCSYIPQRSGISLDISALDVVLMGFNPRLGLLEQPSAAMIKAAAKALERVGLSEKEQMNFQHLSEGQKQLCIMARTLVSGSQLLLLDEPESALDFRYRYQMLALLRDFVRERKRAAIVTLHDPTLALNCCDRLILLSGKRVLGEVAPQEEPLVQVEKMLSSVYGDVSLQWCVNRSGKKQLVMLKEDEA